MGENQSLVNAKKASFVIPDPGASGTIRCTKQFGVCNLVSTGAEARAVVDPSKEGLRFTIAGKSIGGNVTLTFASAVTESGVTVVVVTEAGQMLDLVSVPTSATTFGWRLTGRDGTVGFASGRIIPLAVTTALTGAMHGGKTIAMSGAGGARTFTLPPTSEWLGEKIKCAVSEVNTSNYLIKSPVGTALFKGKILGASTTDSATDACRTWTPGATDDTITLNGTTQGGVAIGDWIEFECISATQINIFGVVTQSGVEATPFSDSVA